MTRADPEEREGLAVVERVLLVELDEVLLDAERVVAVRDLGPPDLAYPDVADLPAPTLFDRHRTEVLDVPDPIDAAALDELLDGLGPDVLRAKAIVRVADPAGGEATPSAVQVVGRRRRIEPLPQSDLQDPTGLVVISLDR